MLTERYRLGTPNPATPDAVATTVNEIVQRFEWKGPVGCTLPARIQRGICRTATNIHASWIETPVQSLFETATGCDFAVLNDADAAGLASMTFGVGRGRTDVVIMLTVGTGIGSALFSGGHLVPGSELGHLTLHGETAELYASDRTRKQEALSWAQWAGRFQEYLDLVEFLLAPDLIVIGGGVSRPDKVAEYLHLLSTRAELIPATLENEAGIIGAAAAARELV